MQKQRRIFSDHGSGRGGIGACPSGQGVCGVARHRNIGGHPTISNMLVVGCYDTKMMKTTPTAMTFAAQNTAIDTARLQANMDAMAMQLANQTTADAPGKPSSGQARRGMPRKSPSREQS